MTRDQTHATTRLLSQLQCVAAYEGHISPAVRQFAAQEIGRIVDGGDSNPQFLKNGV